MRRTGNLTGPVLSFARGFTIGVWASLGLLSVLGVTGAPVALSSLALLLTIGAWFPPYAG